MPFRAKKDRINGGLSRACAWIYFALTKPNMASDIASMSGAAISSSSGVSVARVSPTICKAIAPGAKSIMIPMSAFYAPRIVRVREVFI